MPTGYTRHGSIYVKDEDVVKPSKLRKGLQKASEEISSVLAALEPTSGTDKFSVREIELQVSFDAEGKFMGIGVGSGISLTLRVVPTS